MYKEVTAESWEKPSMIQKMEHLMPEIVDEKKEELSGLNIPFIFAQIATSLEELNFESIKHCFDALSEYLRYFSIELYTGFFTLNIPTVITACLKFDPSAFQEPVSGLCSSSVVSAITFIGLLLCQKQDEFLKYLIDDDFKGTIQSMCANVPPDCEIAEPLVHLMNNLASYNDGNDYTFVRDICDPDFFAKHIGGTPQTRIYLSGLLSCIAGFKNGLKYNDDIIEIIDEFRKQLNEDEISVKSNLIIALRNTGKTVTQNTTDDESINEWLSTLFDKDLIDFGISLLDSDEGYYIDVSSLFFFFLCVQTEIETAPYYPKIVSLLGRSNEESVYAGLDLLAKTCSDNPTMAIKVSQNTEIIGLALNILQEGSNRLKMQAGLFLCSLFKNCGQEFVATIIDTSFISDLLDIFRCNDEDFCLTFAREFYSLVERITDRELRDRIIQEFCDNDGVDTFQDVCDNDGELPDYTESFLQVFIDNSEYESD